MAHFAKVLDGKVIDVIVAEPEFFDTFVDETPGDWYKTSINMRGGVYYDSETNEPHEDQSLIDGDEARERKNFASVGYTYDKDRNAFIPEQPFPSWTLNEDTCRWDPPTPRPAFDGQTLYAWNEDDLEWEVIDTLENPVE